MNNTIKGALYDILIAANLGYEIAFPAIKFTPPDSGIWLEVEFSPSSDLDNALAYDSGYIPRGFFQVSVYDRAGHGSFIAGVVAEQIQTLYAKGTAIAGTVRVVSRPHQMGFDAMDDKFVIAVSIEYSG